MLGRSLYRASGIALWPISLSFLFVCSAKVWSSDLVDQAAIVEAFSQTNSQDRALAQSLAEQARGRSSVAQDPLCADLGPLVKLWCDAAAIAPNPENLAECARFRFAAVGQMSNPQPSADVVRMQRAQESLIMIRAALEIAGGDPSVSDALRHRLYRDADCLRGFISGVRTSKDCN